MKNFLSKSMRTSQGLYTPFPPLHPFIHLIVISPVLVLGHSPSQDLPTPQLPAQHPSAPSRRESPKSLCHNLFFFQTVFSKLQDMPTSTRKLSRLLRLGDWCPLCPFAKPYPAQVPPNIDDDLPSPRTAAESGAKCSTSWYRKRGSASLCNVKTGEDVRHK